MLIVLSVGLVYGSRWAMSYDGEKARGEAGDEIFASSGTDNCVVGTGNSRAVIGSHHQAHLNELAGILGQPAHRREHIT